MTHGRRRAAQGGALRCGIAAAAERLLQSRGHLGIGEIAVRRRDDQGRAGDDAQDLGDALARLQDRRPPGIRWVWLATQYPATVKVGRVRRR